MSPALQEIVALAIFAGSILWVTARWVRRRRARDCAACAPSVVPDPPHSRSLNVLPPRS